MPEPWSHHWSHHLESSLGVSLSPGSPSRLALGPEQGYQLYPDLFPLSRSLYRGLQDTEPLLTRAIGTPMSSPCTSNLCQVGKTRLSSSLGHCALCRAQGPLGACPLPTPPSRLRLGVWEEGVWSEKAVIDPEGRIDASLTQLDLPLWSGSPA